MLRWRPAWSRWASEAWRGAGQQKERPWIGPHRTRKKISLLHSDANLLLSWIVETQRAEIISPSREMLIFSSSTLFPRYLICYIKWYGFPDSLSSPVWTLDYYITTENGVDLIWKRSKDDGNHSCSPLPLSCKPSAPWKINERLLVHLPFIVFHLHSNFA